MFSNIRRMLLKQFIGAIVIALLATQGISALLSLFLMPISFHFVTMRQAPDIFGGQRMFDWNQAIVLCLTAVLHLGAASILIRWPYFAETNASSSTSFDAAPEQ